MKSISCGLLLLIMTVLHAQTDTQIIIGKADQVYSKILHENRQIWVHIPDDHSPDGVFAKQHYPVIYLLDGWEPNFSIVTAMVEQLSGGGGNLSFPKMIVVGIPNTDRTRDLTPTKTLITPAGMDSMEASRSGGGEKFIAFLEKELFPHIDSLYSTAPYKIFIGHSLGGLMSVHTLINHTNLFNAYVAIDPSTFWDNQIVLKQIKEAIQQKNFEKNSLFLAIANSMNSGTDTSIIGPIMRCNFQLRDYLEADKKTKLTFAAKYYQDYDHHSVPVPAEYDGLRFLFKFYNFNFPFGEFFKPTYKSDTLLGEHYKKVSQRMGYRVSPPEDFINGIAHQLMSLNQFDRANYFFEMNIANHPDSFNAYDSMGDLFVKKGDNQKAIEYYSKSLLLHESTDTRQKLEKLQSNK
jgi:uncharacterized protein